MKTQDLTKMAICVALMSVSAYISFPIPFSVGMVTALTIILNLVAFILTPKQAFTVVGTYILLGAVGVPVFVGGTAGLGKLIGPTGGFIFGYLVAVPLMSYLRAGSNSFKKLVLLAIFVGMPVIYIGGCISMSLVMQLDLMSTLLAAVIPFIPGDIIKSFAAAYLGVKMNQVFASRG